MDARKNESVFPKKKFRLQKNLYFPQTTRLLKSSLKNYYPDVFFPCIFLELSDETIKKRDEFDRPPASAPEYMLKQTISGKWRC